MNWLKENTKFAAFTNEVSAPLTADYEKIEHVDGLKTPLFEHQKTIVAAMVDIEKMKEHQITCGAGHKYTISTTSCMLTESVGCGKTFELLATILHNKKLDPAELNYTARGIVVGYKIKFKSSLNPSLIFVGSSVLKQWEDTIAKYTTLSMFVVRDLKCYLEFVSLIETGKINTFDVILVKNGTVARSAMPNNIAQSFQMRSNPHLYSLIANMPYLCWNRVVLDDCDTSNLDFNSFMIHANFTWFVSSTHKIVSSRSHTIYGVRDYVLSGTTTLGAYLNGKHIFQLKNSPEYVRMVSTSPSPTFFVYRFKNNNAALLNALGHDINRNIVEMINADAIATAAESLGIKSNSTADIFEHVLGDKHKDVVFYCKVLNFIESQKNTRKHPHTEANGNYGVRMLESFTEIKYDYPGLSDFIKEQTAKYTNLKSEAMIALERIKSHLIDGECPICMFDLKQECDGGIFIYKCCSVIVCDKCTVSGIFKNTKRGKCPNCRHELVIDKNTIYIDRRLDLDKIVNDMDSGNMDDHDGGEIDEKNIEEKDAEQNLDDHVQVCDKYAAIVAIINGKKIKPVEEVGVRISTIVSGSCAMPEATKKKFLVFANYDETLSKIQKAFKVNKINYERLQGRPKDIANMVDRFRDSATHNVLLVNSIRNCAGLNLQFASDIIFAHSIIDDNVHGQVAGRVMRIGRTTAIKFHYLLFDNEYNEEIVSGRIYPKM